MFKNYSLRIKLIAIFFAALALLTVLLLSAFFFGQNYIEDQLAKDNLKSAQYIIGSSEHELLRIEKDYADWDAMLKWIDTRDAAWIKKNVTDWVPNHFGVDLIVVTDMKGNILYEHGDFPEYKKNIADNPLVKTALGYKDVCGILKTSKGLALVAASPIEDTLAKPPKPQNGVYLYGEIIDEKLLESIQGAAGYDSDIFEGEKLQADIEPHINSLPRSIAGRVYNEKKAFIIKNPFQMEIYAPLFDLKGEAVGILRIARDRSILWYSIAAILATALIALFICGALLMLFSSFLIERLLRLRKAYSQIEKGEIPEPIEAADKDEIGDLTNAFNQMSAELKDSRGKMANYTSTLEKEVTERTELFENSPVSIWEEDGSEVKKYIDRLRDSGVKDFRKYFEEHPDEVMKCASMIKVINVNKITLDMYKAKTKEEFYAGLGKVFAEESYSGYKEILIAQSEGKTRFEVETVNKSFSGEKMNVDIKMFIPPESEKTHSRILISIVDITKIKKTEEALKEKIRELQEFYESTIGRELKMEEMEKEMERLKNQEKNRHE